MYLSRKIDQELQLWAKDSQRKPLVLRGARQVGKSTVVRNLGKLFKYYIEVNFDENPSYKNLFNQNLSPENICEQLSVLMNIPIVAGETLVFFDEIQSCLPAISSLRYFYEKLPDLHIIAAGSLIEFALAELPSFGVGRVRFLYLYPFSFEEFLLSNHEERLLEILKNASPEQPLNEIIHEKLKQYWKKFLIIGGMPEVVSNYIQHKDLLKVQRILDDLIISMQADFSKYKNRMPSIRIKEVFESVVQQVGQKFTYSYAGATLTNIQIKEALRLLEMAGLVVSVTHSSCNGIPLGAGSNPKFIKYIVLDTGIFQRLLGLSLSNILLENDTAVANKGSIAELFVGLELLKNSSFYESTRLFYWQRESRSSQA
ncbi:MAG: AAA family ATPase, partial [Cytophagales bacterium]|nr:AAA family ATPase [Cytophagales bacterium]